jgi:hypothetical protein
VLRYLSDEWLARLDGALRQAAPAPGEGTAVVEQVVTGCPDVEGGTRRFHLVVGPGGARVHAGPAGPSLVADVTVVVDHATAAAIARGHENLQGAIARGRCRLAGHPERLVAVSGVLDALGRAAASLRAETELPA